MDSGGLSLLTGAGFCLLCQILDVEIEMGEELGNSGAWDGSFGLKKGGGVGGG